MNFLRFNTCHRLNKRTDQQQGVDQVFADTSGIQRRDSQNVEEEKKDSNVSSLSQSVHNNEVNVRFFSFTVKNKARKTTARDFSFVFTFENQ